MAARSLTQVLLGLVIACGASNVDEDVLPEPSEEAIADIPIEGPDETDSADALAPVGYDNTATDFLDVRGVGTTLSTPT